MGKGQGFGSLSPAWNSPESRQVISHSDSDCDLPRGGDREPLFEGFSFPGEGFNLVLTDHRISVLQTAKRLCLLGCLSSLCHLVPGGRLRMRSLQLVLRDHWDFKYESVTVSWTPSIESVLDWWSDVRHLLVGVSLDSPQPDLLFWSDASDQGWGRTSSTSSPWVAGPRWSGSTSSIFGNS